MRIKKLSDANNRNVSVLEIMMSYLFGTSNSPKEFVSGSVYNAGDIAYKMVDGSPIMYICNTDGTYTNMDTGWDCFDIGTLVANSAKEYINLILDQDEYAFSENDTGLSGVRTFYEYHVYDKTNLNFGSNTTGVTIDIPVEYSEFDTLVDIFIDNKRISTLAGDYSINEDMNQIQLINYTIDTDTVIALYIAKGVSHNAKLIMEKDLTPTITTDTTGTYVQTTVDTCLFNPVFDLYYDQLYVPPSEYTKTYTSGVVKFKLTTPANYTLTASKFWIRYKASRSNHITVHQLPVNLLSQPVSNISNFSFRFDLRETGYENYIKDYRVYANGKQIDGTHLTLFNDVLSIDNMSLYVDSTVTSLWFVGIYYKVNTDIVYNDTIRFHEESITVMTSDEGNHLPVPFVDYRDEYQRYLLLKEDGTYVLAKKYYEKNGLVHYYPHEEAMVTGDVMNFVMVNNDPSVKVFSRYYTITTENQTIIPIPWSDFNSKETNILLFKEMGSYISNVKYTIDDTTKSISLLTGIGLAVGDILEFVFISYDSSSVNSLKDLRPTTVTDATNIRLPYYNLNFNTDTILIFRDNGTFIGNSRYTINQNTYAITITDGTSIVSGDSFDVLVLRDLKEPISKTIAITNSETL